MNTVIANRLAFVLALCITDVLGAPRSTLTEPIVDGPTAFKQRIINGEIADVGAHPHQVSLQFYSDIFQGWFHICGGSVIGAEFVLTAAHCVDFSNVHLYRLVINDHNLFDGFVGNEQIVAITHIYAHEGYEEINEEFQLYPNDVAVLKLANVIEDQSTIITMVTSQSAGSFDGDNCVISGWGTTEDGPGPAELIEANMTVLSEAECNLFFAPFIFQGHVCIFNGVNNVTGAASCNGDSGGPLVCDGLLVGVTSWGIRNCRLDDGSFVPSVYARVSYYYDWIQMQMQKFSMGRG